MGFDVGRAARPAVGALGARLAACCRTHAAPTAWSCSGTVAGMTEAADASGLQAKVLTVSATGSSHGTREDASGRRARRAPHRRRLRGRRPPCRRRRHRRRRRGARRDDRRLRRPHRHHRRHRLRPAGPRRRRARGRSSSARRPAWPRRCAWSARSAGSRGASPASPGQAIVCNTPGSPKGCVEQLDGDPRRPAPRPAPAERGPDRRTEPTGTLPRPVLKLVLPKGSLEKATLELFEAADLAGRSARRRSTTRPRSTTPASTRCASCGPRRSRVRRRGPVRPRHHRPRLDRGDGERRRVSLGELQLLEGHRPARSASWSPSPADSPVAVGRGPARRACGCRPSTPS